MVQIWLFASFTRKRSFVPFALFCALAFALVCAHLPSFALICVFLRTTALRTTAFGNCRLCNSFEINSRIIFAM